MFRNVEADAPACSRFQNPAITPAVLHEYIILPQSGTRRDTAGYDLCDRDHLYELRAEMRRAMRVAGLDVDL